MMSQNSNEMKYTATRFRTNSAPSEDFLVLNADSFYPRDSEHVH
jgi:hypothetical protein